ncbi:MAG: phosphotransferase, partial [Planctomycetales bacterium]|nr:phosphotransferase [Planctomycetales bacterium]
RATIDTPLPMQPCIRDIWHDHVLFVGERVAGIVDFGAMRLDSVAGDLARLLGSFVRDDRIRWSRAIEWYDAVRRLSDAERQAISVFDAANRLLSGFSWLDWVYFQNRTFEHDDAVLARVDKHLGRLQAAL